MGKLLIFVGIIVVTVVVVSLWGLLLENRQQRAKMGLQGSKKRLAELESNTERYRSVLLEIQSIADASVITGPPDAMWDLVLRKANDVLNDDNDKGK